MARPNQRRKTQREQVDLKDTRPQQLDVTRRYLFAGGYDKNVRTARALENAFRVGSEGYINIKNEQNLEARRQAVAERGAGQERREDEKNAAYHRQWDELDARYDYLEFESELAKEMDEVGAGDWDEAQLQEFLKERMMSAFGGIENLGESAYAQTLAPKLMELEMSVIGAHREQTLAKLQQEKRVKISEAARGELDHARRLDPNAMLDYAKLFEDTGKLFSGENKKVTFWESIYDIAYDLGDPSIITNVPEFMNGVPTGSNDPAFLREQQAMIDRATNEAARRDKVRAEAQAAIDKEAHRQLILEASIASINGRDVSEFIPRLIANPFGTGEELRSLETSRRSSLDEFDSRSWSPQTVTGIWSEIFNGNVSVNDIRDLHANGYLGRGPQSTTLAEDMMRSANAIALRGDSDDGSWAQWNSQIDRDIPKSGLGPVETIDPKMGPVNTEAKRLYLELTTEQGMRPKEAYDRIREQFDPVVDRLMPGLDRPSQSTLAAVYGISYTPQQVDALLSNKMTVPEFVGARSMDEVLIQISNMNLSQEKLDQLALKLTQP